MSENKWRINITCPRCQFRGDVEENFPCGHTDDWKQRALAAEKERDEIRSAANEALRLAAVALQQWMEGAEPVSATRQALAAISKLK